MQLVADNQHIEPQTPQPVDVPPAEPAVPLPSLEAIADLAEKHRDPLMKVWVRKHVRLVSIEPGRLSINLTEGAPAELVGDLSRKLGEWTQTRWIVLVSREQGGATLEELDNDKRDALFADATRDPDVAAILDAFPGAKVVDVRINTADTLDDEAIDTDIDMTDAVIDPDDLTQTD